MASVNGAHVSHEAISDLDICVVRILSNTDCMPRHEVTEQLVLDIDETLLNESRNLLFDLAKLKLSLQCTKEYGPIAARGYDQIEEVKPRKRTGERKNVSLANDIYDLYCYKMDYTESFPRNVTSQASHIPELKRKAQPPPNALEMGTNLKVIELTAEVVEMRKQLKEIKRDHQVEIDRLNITVNKLKIELGQHTCMSLSPRYGKMPISSDSVSGNKPLSQSNTRPRANSEPVQTYANVITKKSAGRETALETNNNKPEKNNNNETGSNTECSKNDKPIGPISSSKSSVNETHKPAQVPNDTVPNDDEGFTLVERGRNRKDSVTRFGERRQVNLQSLGHLKQRSTSNAKTLNTSKTRTLKGIAYEKTQTLYLENVGVEYGDTDSEIEDLVMEHIKSNIGINVTKMYVVRNKYSTIRVGIKLIVPQSAANKAIESDAWPHPVTCRPWEYKPSSRGKRIPPQITYRSNRYRDEQDPSSYAYDEDYINNDDAYYSDIRDSTKNYESRLHKYSLRATENNCSY
ncbi:unnamed protein product [Owenia fusiformis]|uniref:Uncharacterized protein n=1 Tax=Owenia fusiformis TaxID=6347 RepID=A0A8S4P7Z9_OWEFU|nr:unnamed protein product [Owenia fusiformis]